jgi:hypothetical protein
MSCDERNHELIGKKVAEVRLMTEIEKKNQNIEDWGNVKVLIFDDGTFVYASVDEEGNGPGRLFGTNKKHNFYV